MRSMMQFRIGNAPTRRARRRKFCSCISYLNIVLHQDVKSKNHHHLAGSHTSGNHLDHARQMRQADLSLSRRSQVPARAYYRWTGWINGKATTKTISEEIARECQKRI